LSAQRQTQRGNPVGRTKDGLLRRFTPRNDKLSWQLLPHFADLGPSVVLQALFQIEHGKIVAAAGAC